MAANTERPGEPLRLDEDTRGVLSRWAAEPEVSAGVARRAAVILAIASGLNNAEAALSRGVSAHMAGRWRRRFAEEGLAGLLDRPRSGPARRVDPGLLTRIRGLTLEEQAPLGGRWTTRSLARALGVSQSSVVRAWRKLEVGYTREALLDLGTPPPQIWGVSEVAGMFLAPPDRLFAVRVRTDAPRGNGPAPGAGVPDAVRRLVLELVARVEEATGKADGRHRVVEAWRFLDGLAAASLGPWEVHLLASGEVVWAAPLRRWFRSHPTFHAHRASARRTWPENVERWCKGILTAQGLRMRHRPVELRDALLAWLGQPPGGAAFAWTPAAGPSDDVRGRSGGVADADPGK